MVRKGHHHKRALCAVAIRLVNCIGKVLRTVHVGQTSRFATMAMLHGYLHVPTLAGVVVIHTG